jgi:hypothetical protein
MPRVAVSGRVAKSRAVSSGRVAKSRTIPNTRFGDLLQIANKRPVFTADYYTVDGGTGRVGSFIDWNDPTHLLTQSTGPSFQVLIPAAHADFNNKLCADFPATSTFYTSNRPASYYTYLVNDSTSYLVLTPKGTAFALWAETADSTSDWSMQYNTQIRGITDRGGTGLTTGNGTVTANVPLALEFAFSVPQARRSMRVTGRSEVAVTLPIGGTAQVMPNTLTIGGRSGLGIGHGNMRWAFFSPMNGLSQAERDAVGTVLLQLYGLALT